ncbi:MAG: M23 family metallopeptidase [Tahibacter sp.]
MNSAARTWGSFAGSGVVWLGVAIGAGAAPSAFATEGSVTAPQGGVGRWSGLAASECGVYGKRYKAVDAVCYYPVDIRTPAGRHEIALWDKDGKQHLAWLDVEKTNFPKVEMDLPERLDRFLHVSPEDGQRAATETAQVAKILGGHTDAPRFSLPLGKPAASLPKSEDDFGSERTFNHERKSLHSGRDYPVGLANSIKAVADGTVVLAAEHFFTGNAVYIDHGDGLISMSFHLKSISVKVGDTVKRGQTIGKVGATGRATGPHLHLGLRWLGKRIDPALLLQSPDKLPSVSDSKRQAEEKIQAAQSREPNETDAPLDEED